MTVTIFDTAIAAYAQESPDLAREIERNAQKIVQFAQANVRVIMHRAPFDVAQNVGYIMEGNEAVVGIDISQTLHGGRSAELYLDQKAIKEGGSWLGDAIKAARG